MNRQQVQLASAVIPAVAPLARATISERMQLKAMERQKEMELDLIRAKREVGDRGGSVLRQTGAPAPRPEPEPEPRRDTQRVVEKGEDEFSESIDALIGDEDCDMCVKLLEGIKNIDSHKRPQALAEYGRFKQSVDDAASVDDVREQLEDLSVLKEVMQAEFNMAPS